MKIIKKNHILIFALILGVILTRVEAQQAAKSEELYLNCPMPLSLNNFWEYDIFQSDLKVGELKIEITDLQEIVSDSDDSWLKGNVYTACVLSYHDSYLQKKYRKKILADYNKLFIADFNKSLYNIYLPNSSWRFREGLQLGDMLVVSLSEEKLFNEERVVGMLHHLSEEIIEKYASRIGLIYYKNRSLVYKLKKFKINEEACKY